MYEDVKILIVDDEAFSRVCGALLEFEGYQPEIAGDPLRATSLLTDGRYRLVITSYPFGSSIFPLVKQCEVPLIVLSDCINRDMLQLMEGLTRHHCMIKPLDFARFRTLVRHMMTGDTSGVEGFSIV